MSKTLVAVFIARKNIIRKKLAAKLIASHSSNLSKFSTVTIYVAIQYIYMNHSTCPLKSIHAFAKHRNCYNKACICIHAYVYVHITSPVKNCIQQVLLGVE